MQGPHDADPGEHHGPPRSTINSNAFSRCLPSRAVVHGFRQCSNVLAGLAQGDELAARRQCRAALSQKGRRREVL
jgi:hypothetical protein